MVYPARLDARSHEVEKRPDTKETPASYPVFPIGFIRSDLKRCNQAPRQGSEGAPDAWLELASRFFEGLEGIEIAEEIIIITWLHEAQRDTLKVHPGGDQNSPLTGIFLTRSPNRPNPLGLHRVTVREIDGNRIRIGPIEAIDGTPVIDMKAAIGLSDN